MTALLANGPIFDYHALFQRLQSFKFLVAVDGGLRHFHALKLRPDLIIGDFDSIPEALLTSYKDVLKKKYPTLKDASDLELALEEVTFPATLFGALHERMDHSLYTLYLLEKYREKLTIETEIEVIMALKPSTKIPAKKGQTLSLMPLCEPATAVSTEGLRWELKNHELNMSFKSLSNVAIKNHPLINYEKGCIICFIQKGVT